MTGDEELPPLIVDAEPAAEHSAERPTGSGAVGPEPRPGADATDVPPPFDPHFWAVARRARWIGTLVLVLAIASGFAFLGRWQLERAITPRDDTQTEVAVPLDSLATPQQPAPAGAYWRMVTANLSIEPGDAIVLSGRTNTGSETGYWVVVHATEDDTEASLAVAVGWTADEAIAEHAATELDAPGPLDGATPLGEVTGRYLPSESADESDFEHDVRSALSTPELVNLWHEPTAPVYGGYLVLREPLAGLTAIDSPPPLPPEEVNLLNLFYAVEWVLFAGAAVFIWWRLVRDTELKELGIDPARVRRDRAAARRSP